MVGVDGVAPWGSTVVESGRPKCIAPPKAPKGAALEARVLRAREVRGFCPQRSAPVDRAGRPPGRPAH